MWSTFLPNFRNTYIRSSLYEKWSDERTDMCVSSRSHAGGPSCNFVKFCNKVVTSTNRLKVVTTSPLIFDEVRVPMFIMIEVTILTNIFVQTSLIMKGLDKMNFLACKIQPEKRSFHRILCIQPEFVWNYRRTLKPYIKDRNGFRKRPEKAVNQGDADYY